MTESGTFNMTTISLKSAFEGIGDATNGYQSKTFNKFCNSLEGYRQRVEAQYAGAVYPAGSSLAGKTFDPANGGVDKYSAGDDAGDIVGVNSFQHEKGLGDRSAFEVVGVRLQSDNAVGVAVKDIRAAAERLGGLLADDRKVALREAELMSLVISKAAISVRITTILFI